MVSFYFLKRDYESVQIYVFLLRILVIDKSGKHDAMYDP